MSLISYQDRGYDVEVRLTPRQTYSTFTPPREPTRCSPQGRRLMLSAMAICCLLPSAIFFPVAFCAYKKPSDLEVVWWVVGSVASVASLFVAALMTWLCIGSYRQERNALEGNRVAQM